MILFHKGESNAEYWRKLSPTRAAEILLVVLLSGLAVALPWIVFYCWHSYHWAVSLCLQILHLRFLWCYKEYFIFFQWVVLQSQKWILCLTAMLISQSFKVLRMVAMQAYRFVWALSDWIWQGTKMVRRMALSVAHVTYFLWLNVIWKFLQRLTAVFRNGLHALWLNSTMMIRRYAILLWNNRLGRKLYPNRDRMGGGPSIDTAVRRSKTDRGHKRNPLVNQTGTSKPTMKEVPKVLLNVSFCSHAKNSVHGTTTITSQSTTYIRGYFLLFCVVFGLHRT